MALLSPLPSLVEKITKLGARFFVGSGTKAASLRLIPLLPADKGVRNFVTGLAGIASARAIRKEKGRKPVRGIPRRLAQVNLRLTQAQGVLSGAAFEAIIQATQFLDLATDSILEEPFDAIVDIPEDILTRAAEGYKEINAKLIELNRERIESKLSRKR